MTQPEIVATGAPNARHRSNAPEFRSLPLNPAPLIFCEQVLANQYFAQIKRGSPRLNSQEMNTLAAQDKKNMRAGPDARRARSTHPTSALLRALLRHGSGRCRLVRSRDSGGSGVSRFLLRHLLGGFGALALLMAAIVELLVSSLFLHNSIMSQIRLDAPPLRRHERGCPTLRDFRRVGNTDPDRAKAANAAAPSCQPCRRRLTSSSRTRGRKSYRRSSTGVADQRRARSARAALCW
jgi:hypothetical protein